jgi:basic amino acid/polyamine antiporter, APA family
VLYIVVAAILTGIVPLREISADPEMSRDFLKAPVAYALSFIHQDWASWIISVGAVMGITTVLLVMLFGQPRIFFAMSRDGLLPEKVSKVHPRFGTPYITTIITGALVCAFALLVTIGTVAELTNIGTLFAFAIVSIGVPVLRKTNPEAKRSFKVPLLWLVSPLSVLLCVYLMYSLPVMTWIRFLLWLDIGLILYFFYGHSNSRIVTSKERVGHRTPKYLLQFFGLAVILNAVLFGLLALLTLAGVAGEKSWTEVGFIPTHALRACLFAAAVGCGMWFAPRFIRAEV